MVDRVLDVRQGELCWVVGTVYMELGMKPNVLDDIAKEVLSTYPCFNCVADIPPALDSCPSRPRNLHVRYQKR
jgi:hypothetical protein